MLNSKEYYDLAFCKKNYEDLLDDIGTTNSNKCKPFETFNNQQTSNRKPEFAKFTGGTYGGVILPSYNYQQLDEVFTDLFSERWLTRKGCKFYQTNEDKTDIYIPTIISPSLGTLFDSMPDMYLSKWNHLWKDIQGAEYQPTDNVDRYEYTQYGKIFGGSHERTPIDAERTNVITKSGTEEITKTGTETTGKTGKETTEKTGTETTGKTGKETTEKTGTETTGKTGTEKTSDGGSEVNTRTGVETSEIQGLNSTDYSGSERTLYGTSTSDANGVKDTKTFINRESELSFQSRKDTTSFDNRKDTTSFADRKDTLSFADRKDTLSFADRKDTLSFADRKDTTSFDDRKDTETLSGGELTRVHGNIGVTMTTQLLDAEIEFRKWQFFRMVMDDIAEYLFLKCY